MALTGVFHTGWTVADLDRSLHFYVDLLGLEVAYSNTQNHPYIQTQVGLPGANIRYALLRLPGDRSGHLIELLQYLSPPGVKTTTRPCDVGSAHFAFFTDDCRGLYERLSAKGVRFVNPPVAIAAGKNKGGFACYSRDPDDFIVEFLQPGPDTHKA